MGWKLLLKQDIAHTDGIIVLAQKLVHTSQNDGKVREDRHLFGELIVDIIVRKVCVIEAVVHGFECFNHYWNTLLMNLLIETHQLENWEVIIPKFYRSIEYQPSLIRLRPQFDSFDDMLGEFAFLFLESSSVFISEISFILVIIQCYQIFMSDLDFFFEEILDVAFC